MPDPTEANGADRPPKDEGRHRTGTPPAPPRDTAPQDTASPDTASPDTAPPDRAPAGTTPEDVAPPPAPIPAAAPAATPAAVHRDAPSSVGADAPRPEDLRPDQNGRARSEVPDQASRQHQPPNGRVPADDKTPRERLAEAFLRPRPSRGQVMAALLLALLGFAVAIQVRSTSADTQLRGARQSDLVRILDDVTDRSQRLEDERRKLEVNRDQLLSGTDQSKAALQQAQERAKTLGILAGTLPVHGPGIELSITDPDRKVDAAVLLDTLQELRDAKAEAVQINSVRVVASTHFVDGSPGHVLVDDATLTPPYVFKVIGDPPTLSSALRIPGGVLEVLNGKGADGVVKQTQQVRIDALRQPESPRYARPAHD